MRSNSAFGDVTRVTMRAFNARIDYTRATRASAVRPRQDEIDRARRSRVDGATSTSAREKDAAIVFAIASLREYVRRRIAPGPQAKQYIRSSIFGASKIRSSLAVRERRPPERLAPKQSLILRSPGAPGDRDPRPERLTPPQQSFASASGAPGGRELPFAWTSL